MALGLLGAAPPTERPSFSCAAALTKTERVICDDLELAAWDRAMARVYRGIDPHWGFSIESHRTWLARRDSCAENRACILNVYRDWPGFGETVHDLGKSYERIGAGPRDPGYFNLMQIHGDWSYFTLVALHQQLPDPASTNTGIYAGLIEFRKGVGTYNEGPEDYDCRFRITQNGHDGWSISEFGRNPKCGGLNVFVAGDYVPTKRRRK